MKYQLEERPPVVIVKAYTRLYRDSGQTKAYVEWSDGARTEGEPGNMHIEVLFGRAERNGLKIGHETW